MINNITDEKYLKLTYILKHSIEQEMKSLKFSSINIKNCNKEFIIRKTMDKKLFAYFNNDRYSNICDLLIKINLNKKILNIDKELLSIIPSSEIDEIFKNNSNILTNNKYLSLIRVLILKGYIDKTYWHYKGYFYEGSLGINDIIFIKNINELQNQDSFLELENPSEIVNRLEEDDFYKFNILNKRLLECCINENKIDYVLAIISSVSSNVEYERLAGILENYDYGIIERFVFILLFYNIDDIIELLEVTKDSYGNVYNYVLIAIYANDKIEIDKIKRFNSYIEKNSQVVELAPEDKIDEFYTNISIAGVKFTNLYGNMVNTKRIEDIERLNAYELCIENVVYIAEKISGRNIEYGNLLSEIYNSSLLQCKNYIELNFVSFINEYIEKNINNEVYVNDANILTKILNSDSSNEYKIKYLSLNSTKLYNIKDFKNTFKNEELLNYMFERDTILFNKDNVKIHYDNIEKSSNEFIDYVERNLNDSNVDEILKDNIDMCNEFINISEISDNLFKYVYKYASNHVMTIDPNLSKERVISLIKENLIEINYGNIKMLLDKSWEEEIIMWATSIEKDVQDKVIRELLSHTLEEDLVYKLVNSTILYQNAIKLINSIKSKVLIEKICSEKENLISSIIDRELSIDNINFICNNFKKFTLKNKFIEYLINNNKLNTLSNDNLNEYVMEFVLNLNNIDINTKINLICTKIKNNIDVIFLKKYIESVTEISELAEVWDGKRPKLENEEKRKVGNMLIENGYVSKYGDVEPVRVYIQKNKKEVL